MSIERVDPGDPHEIAAALRSELPETIGVLAAPGRVNLIGEHTDYNEGLCLPIALPHATYVAVARRADGRIRVASRQQDGAFEAALDPSWIHARRDREDALYWPLTPLRAVESTV